jgi:uncharacterized protein (UPF0332 family)
MADWNILASGNYRAANLLVQEQCDRSCLSRAYYAAYSRATHALSASGGVTFPAGREGPSHSALPDLVENHLLRLGQHRWIVSDYLRTLYSLRLLADYWPSASVGAADSETATALMSQLFVLTKGAV